MKSNLITLRFSPEDLEALRGALSYASMKHLNYADEYDLEGHDLENVNATVASWRHLHDATLYAQYPNDPSKRPPTEREIREHRQGLRERWVPWLEQKSTRYLMDLRDGCHATSGRWATNDWQKSYSPFDSSGSQIPLALIKEVLATREHIPNKQERKEARRQKAKAGRQRGRGDR